MVAWLSSFASLKKKSLFVILVLFGALVVIQQNRMIQLTEKTAFSTHTIPLRPSSNYLINTPGCRILSLDPKPLNARKFFKRTSTVKCNDPEKPDLTSSLGNTLLFYPAKIKHYKTVFHPLELKRIDKMTSRLLKKSSKFVTKFLKRVSVKCCYYSILRKTQSLKHYNDSCDKAWAYGNCIPIKAYQTTIKTIDAIVVNCTTKKVIFYTNVHHLVQKRVVESKRPVTSSNDESNRLNVIFFGMDSVSRLNFLRSNPKTYKYLIEELKAFDYKGYNKVGDNTFPNLVPILTGLDKKELKSHRCYTNNTGGINQARAFDACSFIWKEFKKQGYRTIFFEDSPKIGLFNYHKTGFVIQPTDHYGRPSFLVSQQLIGNGNHGKICQRNKLSLKVVQEYSVDVMNTYAKELTFNILWVSALTHDRLNYAVYADIPHLRYLKTLKENGLLNRTVLFFLSDHGMRFGLFRETFLGKVEENMPYLFIVVPDWFKERFPEATQNLENNSNILVTPFDLYATMKDIASSHYENITYIQALNDNRRSISLFQKIPPERTCNDIGFPLQYCLCQEYFPLRNTDEIFSKVSTYIKKELNKLLKPFSNCHQIERVQTESLLVGKMDRKFYKNVNEKVLSVQARYHPGDALIDATLFWREKHKKHTFTMSGDISRINIYGNQSHCVEDNDLKKICICKDIVK